MEIAKVAFRSRIRLVALVGLLLMIVSLAASFLLAKNSSKQEAEVVHIAHTIFSWRERTHRIEEPHLGSHFGKVWKHVQFLRNLFPHAAPRESYPPPSWPGNGYLFAEIKGEFHEIRTSICDLVVIARLLNATLAIPRLHEVAAAKGISSKFKGFGYLYSAHHFITALADDIHAVKLLPKKLRSARKRKTLSVITPPISASPEFYLQQVLPELKKQGALGLRLSRGGGLQSLLPPELAEYQRLRCRVAFHALQFRQELLELGSQMVQRLQEKGRPYLAVHVGLERDTLAYHGCAELFQDLQTESIQSKRAQLIRAGQIKGELKVDSDRQRHKGLCPLMPEEVGILLQVLGYPRDTRIYLSGTEFFGGQRVLLPLRSMYHNLDDHATLSTEEERSHVYGPEDPLPSPVYQPPPANAERLWLEAWEKAGSRPRPLPPPLPRGKPLHEVEGWWGWIGETDTEPRPNIAQTRERGHKLLWAALDYIVCAEANAFFPAFDRDSKGSPNFASLVMGYRLYASASLKTYRPDRTAIANHMDQIDGRSYNLDQEWMVRVRKLLTRSLELEGLANSSLLIKPKSFLAHPLPECACQTGKTKVQYKLDMMQEGPDERVLWGDEEECPKWMATLFPPNEVGEEREEEKDDLEGMVTSTDMLPTSELVPAGEDGGDELKHGEADEDTDPND